MPRLRNAPACRRAVDQAVTWVKAYCGGEEWTTHSQPLLTYHKVPYLFATTGNLEECRRALGWIKANLLTREGNFLAAPAEPGQQPTAAHIREKAWVAIAAHVTGRFDVSVPAAQFFASQQGNSTGGVYEVDNGDRRQDSADVRTTACAGLMFLTAGMLPAARLAGKFLVSTMQPQAGQDSFYIRLNAQGKLVCKFPRASAESHVIGVTSRRPMISYLGIPAIFLARLHLATGELEWVESAMDYFALADRYSRQAEVSEDNTALAWAATLLYSITRARVYYDAAERLTQPWLESQRPDGSWRSRGATKDDAATAALTAQTAMCLIECLREAQ